MLITDIIAGMPPDTITRLGPIMASCVKPFVSDEVLDRLFCQKIPTGWIVTDCMPIPGGIVEFVGRIPPSPIAQIAEQMNNSPTFKGPFR